MFRAAFSDLRFDAEDVIVSGDRAWARVHVTGTNDGEFMGMPATGKSIDVPAVDMIRFNDDGTAAEHWGVSDTMTMMQQLGVVPEGPPGLSRQSRRVRDRSLAGEALADVDGRLAVHRLLPWSSGTSSEGPKASTAFGS